jgi:hypothetical protein
MRELYRNATPLTPKFANVQRGERSSFAAGITQKTHSKGVLDDDIVQDSPPSVGDIPETSKRRQA